MREYIVMKSKYRASNNQFINCLTYSPKTTLAKSHEGTYRHYHEGELVWAKEADDKLYNDVLDGTFYMLDYEEELHTYPIFAEYAESCESFN